MNRRNAFTLIELLVVIAIISLLVSILLPSLNRAKGLAKEVLCLTRQKQIGYAMTMYADEYNDYMCGAVYDNFGGDVTRRHWYNQLSKYGGEQTGDDYHSDTDYYGYSDIFVCPSWTIQFSWNPGYGCVSYFASEFGDVGDFSRVYANGVPDPDNPTSSMVFTRDGTIESRCYRRSEFYRPEVRGWITDSYVWHAGGGPDDTYAPNADPQKGQWPHWAEPETWGKDPERHDGRCNILFANGNARSLGYMVSGHAFWDIDNVPQ